MMALLDATDRQRLSASYMHNNAAAAAAVEEQCSVGGCDAAVLLHTHHVLKLVSLSNGFLQQLNALGVAAASKGVVCNLQSSKCTTRQSACSATTLELDLDLKPSALNH
jgi:hypothetical protein